MKFEPSFISLALLIVYLVSCGSTIWSSPSVMDQEEASYVGGIVGTEIEKFYDGKYNIYACRQRNSYAITVYGLTNRETINTICNNLNKYSNITKPLSTHTVDLKFYENETIVTVGSVPLVNGGKAPLQERQDGPLVESRLITLFSK
jgi:hypothetical protein